MVKILVHSEETKLMFNKNVNFPNETCMSTFSSLKCIILPQSVRKDDYQTNTWQTDVISA